jgi:hypothetical protein
MGAQGEKTRLGSRRVSDCNLLPLVYFGLLLGENPRGVWWWVAPGRAGRPWGWCGACRAEAGLPRGVDAGGAGAL